MFNKLSYNGQVDNRLLGSNVQFVSLFALYIVFLFSTAAHAALLVVTELSPPHQIVEGNEVKGLSTALVKLILKEAELDAEIQMLPWARAHHLAMAQRNTLIYSIARTPEREEQFVWIGPVAIFRLGLVTTSKNKNLALANLAELKNHTIAVQRGDVAAQYLSQKGIAVIETSDIHKSYELLLKNKVDFVVDDPLLLDDMSTLLNVPKDHFHYAFPIEELHVEGFLAANKRMPPEQLQALQNAFKKVARTKQDKSLIADSN